MLPYQPEKSLVKKSHFGLFLGIFSSVIPSKIPFFYFSKIKYLTLRACFLATYPIMTLPVINVLFGVILLESVSFFTKAKFSFVLARPERTTLNNSSLFISFYRVLKMIHKKRYYFFHLFL